MWLTIASPSPRPPCVRVLPGLACRKRSNDVGQEVRADARCRCRCTRQARAAPVRARARTCDRARPRGVNFTALTARFQTTCCSRSGSPSTLTGPRPEVHRQVDAAPVRRGAHRLEPRLHHRAQVDRRRAPSGACRVDDARDVEQVLDQLRLQARVALDHLERARDARRGVQPARCAASWPSPGSA